MLPMLSEAVLASIDAILITGGVFPIDMGFKFEPTVPPMTDWG